MHSGLLSREDLRFWVANRYYYQTRIPIKDALILAKTEDSAFRRVWLRRLIDHDGTSAEPGGLELWRRLGGAVGLSKSVLEKHQELLCPVKQACDAYVELVRDSDLLTAVAASLTECFAAQLMRERIVAWKQHYPWAGADALGYFERRVTEASADAEFALAYVEQHAIGHGERQRCLAAFATKCRILWQLLDAVYLARRLPLVPRLAARALLNESRGGCASASRGLLLAPERGYDLNDTACQILKLCDGKESLAAIVEQLSSGYRVNATEMESDIATFLGELECSRLLVFEPPAL
jgi:pyrroloquinoline-quinone synthase